MIRLKRRPRLRKKKKEIVLEINRSLPRHYNKREGRAGG